MKTILVPISRTNKAIHAMKAANQLALKFNSSVELFFLEKKISASYPSAKEASESRMYTESPLIDHVDRYAQFWGTEEATKIANVQESIVPAADLLVTEASLVRGHYELATESGAEGTKGLFAAGQFFMDDQAEGTKGACAAHDLPMHPAVEDLLKQVHCPVFTVLPQTNEAIAIKTVVLVTDGEAGAGLLFSRVSQLQRVFRFNLHLLHINRRFHQQPAITVLNNMRELAKVHSLTHYQIHIMEDYTYEEGIIHFAEKVQPDMIALPIDGHKIISRLLESVFAGPDARHSSVKYLLTYRVDE